MKKNIQTILFYFDPSISRLFFVLITSVCSPCLFAMEALELRGSGEISNAQEYIELQELQKRWRAFHLHTDTQLQTAAPLYNLSSHYQQLALSKKARPELFSLYIKDDEGNPFLLCKERSAYLLKSIRLYGTTEPDPNYATIGSPALIGHKETFTNPLSFSYEGTRSDTVKRSSSYEHGCYTYYYTMQDGREIQFQRGHGIPQRDTREHGGIISGRDAENFVPQNAKYNNPVREKLEDIFHHKPGYSYKEISIYHPQCKYLVKIKDKRAREKNPYVDIPEGFIFMVFKPDNTIEDLYFFPNFVHYDDIKTSDPDWYSIYKINNLAEWFLMPAVEMGNPLKQYNDTQLADELRRRIVYMAPYLFSDLTEEMMPPKARVALLLTLLEWNMQTAATLEFVTIEQKLNLAYYYAFGHNVYEFDERPNAARQQSLITFLDNMNHSDEARQIIRSMQEGDLPFEDIQRTLEDIVHKFQEVQHNASVFFEFANLFPKPISLTIAQRKHTFNLYLLTQADIAGFKNIIGGYSALNISKANAVLATIEDHGHFMNTTIREKLHLMRLYNDVPALSLLGQNKWPEMLREQAKEQASLLELRKIADFYAYRGNDEERDFWLAILCKRLEENQSIESFYDIAWWCYIRRAAFLSTLSDAHDEGPTTSKLLAFQIFKGIKQVCPTRSEIDSYIENLTNQLGLYIADASSFKHKALIKSSDITWGAYGESATCDVLRKISDVFDEFIKREITSTLEKKDDAASLVLLGRRYKSGLGTYKSEEKAFQLFSRAAEDDNEEALYELAQLYTIASGIEQDEQRGFEQYKKAAKKGHPLAAVIVAEYYKDREEINKYKKWLKRAIEYGAPSFISYAEVAYNECLDQNIPLSVAAQIRYHWLLLGCLALYPDLQDLVPNLENRIDPEIEMPEHEAEFFYTIASQFLQKITHNGYSLEALKSVRSMHYDPLVSQAIQMVLKSIDCFYAGLNSCVTLYNLGYVLEAYKAGEKAISLASTGQYCLQLAKVCEQLNFSQLYELAMMKSKDSLLVD